MAETDSNHPIGQGDGLNEEQNPPNGAENRDSSKRDEHQVDDSASARKKSTSKSEAETLNRTIASNKSIWKARQKDSAPAILALAKSQIPDYRSDGPELCLFSDFDACPVPTHPAKKEQTVYALDKLQATIKREQLRLQKEKEKSDKKALKELERMMKEQKKLEDRQRKQMVRLEKQKEREEKKKEQKERKEKERREMGERRRREAVLSRRDDVELEWDELCERWRREKGVGDDAQLVEGEVAGLVRGNWPVDGVEFVDLWPGTEIKVDGKRPLDAPDQNPDANGRIHSGISQERDTPLGQLCSTWSFLANFSSLLAIDPPSLDVLAAAFLQRSPSPLLFKIHMALLRLIQVDAEESKGMMSGSSTAAHHRDNFNTSKTNNVYYSDASLLEEAWSWGFDVDCWRAHLNEATWMEVCRQVCIAAGLGRKRPLSRRNATGSNSMGKLGEDMVVVPETGKVELKLPARLVESSVKGACWMVLKDAGIEGLRVDEIARRIQKTGLRDLRTSRTPETSVAGAMGRDALFERLAPGTYALSSILNHQKELLGAEGVDDEVREDEETEEKKENEDGDNEENDEMDHDANQDEHDAAKEGEEWLEKLKESSYEALSIDERAALLSALCHLCMDSMTTRLTLQRRYDEQQRIKKAKSDDDKLVQNLLRARKMVEVAEKSRCDEFAAKMEAAKAAAEKEGRAFNKSEVPTPEIPKEEVLLAEKVVEAENEINKAARLSGSFGNKSPADNLAEFNKNRAEHALKELKMNPIRLDPLGTDRRWNKYWRLTAGHPRDDCAGDSDPSEVDRIYVETDSGAIKYIPNSASFSALVKSLSEKGPREKELKKSLSSISKWITSSMPVISFPSVAAGIDSGFDSADQYHCICDLSPCATDVVISEELDVEGGNQTIEDAIRRGIMRVCTVLNEEQLVPGFDKTAFQARIPTCRSIYELRSLLGDLELAIPQEFIHSNFVREPLLVKGAWIAVGSEVATAAPGSSFADQMLSPDLKGAPLSLANGADGTRLAWLPLTAPSIALRLMALDASIFYRNDSCGRDVMPEYRASQRPFPDGINRMVESMYCINGGHVDAAFFSPYPYRMNFGPRMDFIFPVDQFLEDVEKGSDEPVKPLNHTQVTLAAAHPGRPGRGGRGGRSGATRGRAGRGRGGRGRGRGRKNKSTT